MLEDGMCLGQVHELIGRGHAERLMPEIAALPNGGRADRIIVDVGPGSFTGLRVGIAAARALGFAWNAPVTGYQSLSMVASLAQQLHQADEPLCVAMNGGHGELFWRLFDCNTLDPGTLAPVTDTTSTPIAQLATMIECQHIYGSGAEALVQARGYGVPHIIHPNASQFAGLPAQFHLHDVAAQYGRDADAKPSAKIVSTPHAS